MTTLSLLQLTGGSARAEAMVEFCELGTDLSGQTITLDGRNNLASTTSFCTRLLQILLIERQAACVEVKMCGAEVAGMFEMAAVELEVTDRLQVRKNAPGVKTVTVSMTDLTVARVQRLAERYGDTKTDIINRSVALFEMLDELDRNGSIYTRGADGGLELLRMVR